MVLGSAQELRIERFIQWFSMAHQLHPGFTSPSALQSVGCSGVKHTTGLWTIGDVNNHTSLSGNLTDESGFGRYQENSTYLTLPNVKFGGGYGMGLSL